MKESKASTGVSKIASKEKKNAKDKENTKHSQKTSVDEHLKCDKDDDEMDLNKELYSIGHYINNKEELVNQLFSVIKSNDLKALLPPCLKNYSVSELKHLCLHHLQLMSQKRILNILQGTSIFSSSEAEEEKLIQTIPQSASSTTSHCDQTETTRGIKRLASHFEDKQQADSTSIDLPEIPTKKKNLSTTSELPAANDVIEVDTAGEGLDLCPNEEEINSLMKESYVDKKQELQEKSIQDSSDGQVHISSTTVTVEMGEKEWLNAFTKTQLEILELEMRARAIRSLMKAQGLHTSEDDESLHKIDKKKDSSFS
ncbi:caspase activity and apoptosis inhibitor 1-like [Centruroides vittatus]|uniref:caspase activity and apoptosis inhibitor 1-like n=1 Tax=Centruroides vittatus TaxID=120091 RepID=UPI003510D1BB